tara:strand:- start:654 stop:896 length:243 start_codon:yes stop_codon:yes gene_type:complete
MKDKAKTLTLKYDLSAPRIIRDEHALRYAIACIEQGGCPVDVAGSLNIAGVPALRASDIADRAAEIVKTEKDLAKPKGGA